LKQMDHLGVREQPGVELAKRLSGKSVFWSPDPTLLVPSYVSLLTPSNLGQYAFTYFLRGGDAANQILRQVSAELGLPMYAPFLTQQRWKLEAKLIQLGPCEWLSHIQNSRFVVTNSFHGTIFAILFRRPFIAVSLSGRKQHLSVRLTSLLQRLGLEDRFVTESEPNKIRRLLREEIDWESVSSRIAEWRTEAEQFWDEALPKR
jgi:hypothetical protein